MAMWQKLICTYIHYVHASHLTCIVKTTYLYKQSVYLLWLNASCTFELYIPVQGVVELCDNKLSGAGDADWTTICA